MSDRPGYVYVFSLGFDNLYKIGFSRNWRDRLRRLATGNPRLRATIVVKTRKRIHPYGAEQSIHGRLKKYRLRRNSELFVFQSHRVLEDVEKILSDYGKIVHSHLRGIVMNPAPQAKTVPGSSLH